MGVIAKADDSQVAGAAQPADTLWLAGWQALWRQVDTHMQRCGAHPARTVLLLPFFQLQALARRTALNAWPHVFLPRIETTKSWQQRVASGLMAQTHSSDISGDVAIDSLRARAWLAQAGLGEQLNVLTPWLVEAAQQLALVASGMPPQQRTAWAQNLRSVLAMPSQNFANYEAAVQRIALEWAAVSRHASDALFDTVQHEVDALIVVRGVQHHELTHSLASFLGDRALWLDLPVSEAGLLYEHTAEDAEDEAQRAAACVLAHVAAGRTPVALPAIDRLVTRRISALLQQQGVALADETGWKLSTTRAAASLMSLLRAAHPQATLDERLDALKHSQASATEIQSLESAFRRQNSALVGMESALDAIKIGVKETTEAAVTGQQAIELQQCLANLRRARPVSQWLADLREALQISGQWHDLLSDAAGQQVIAALHLESVSAAVDWPGQAAPMSLSEFMQWMQTVLEAASFKPPMTSEQGAEASVVVLPLAQLAARPFAAAVMAGCNEQHLPAVPQLQGLWTQAQREAIGLASRAQLAQEQQAVWQRAMQMPVVDVLWCAAQADGQETLQPSPLLLAWKLQHPSLPGQDARRLRSVFSAPSSLPAPSAAVLAQQHFSASSYADVRACPYRYFALRLLGLQEAAELEEGLSKRDFGSWLHDVLSDFHEQRASDTDEQADAELLDHCAASAEQKEFAGDAGFIPFAAAWPQVRDAYLLWLHKHEGEGWRFEASEYKAQRELQGVRLQGRLDRIDALEGSGPNSEPQQRFVIDYKTESDQALRERVSDPLEDTQLAFYAALLGADEGEAESEGVRAAYLGVGEKEAKLVEQKQINEALPYLMEGVTHDAQRIAAGHALPALGEGRVCEFCAARGLCRKDFWKTGTVIAPPAALQS
jgi:ATP-dependent helicase/nuclease subunit B